MQDTRIQLQSVSKRPSLYNDLIDANLRKIATLYDSGLSLQAIGNKLKIGDAALEKLFRLNGIKLRDQGFYARTREFIDEHYFDVIDTEEKAYILGLLYADGSNCKKQHRIAIKLIKSDEPLLARISQIVYGTNHLEKVIAHKNGKIYEYIALRIHSKHISDTLEKHGVVPRKSMVLTFPRWLDEKLYPSFVRGMIDGDGSIYLNEKKKRQVYVSLIGTADINDFIADYLHTKFGMNTYKRPVKKQLISEFYTLVIGGGARCMCFLDWIYKDSLLHLNRKYDRYLWLKTEYKRNAKMKTSEFKYNVE